MPMRPARSIPDALVRMSADEREGSFPDAALWRRALIVAAGPLANFILALVIYTGLFMSYGDSYMSPVVGQIGEGSAAEAAGFQIGDKVVSVEGQSGQKFFGDIQLHACKF